MVIIISLIGSLEENSTFYFNDVEEFTYENYNFPKDILDWGNFYSDHKLGESNSSLGRKILLEENKLNIHNKHEKIKGSKFSNNLISKDHYQTKDVFGKYLIQSYEDKSLNIINKINNQNINSLKKS